MINDLNKLLDTKCEFIGKKQGCLSNHDALELGKLVPQWTISNDSLRLIRNFEFASYADSIAFVNKVATIAEANDHHPDISIGFKTCTIEFWTHTVHGLTINDYICAAKIDAEFEV